MISLERDDYRMYFVPYRNPYYCISTTSYPYVRDHFYFLAHEMQRANQYENWQSHYMRENIQLKDYGNEPFVVNIEEAAEQNNTFRTALWTGRHLQVTLMSINVGEDIGLEIHPTVDQFLRIEEGQGLVQMGNTQ